MKKHSLSAILVLISICAIVFGIVQKRNADETTTQIEALRKSMAEFKLEAEQQRKSAEEQRAAALVARNEAESQMKIAEDLHAKLVAQEVLCKKMMIEVKERNRMAEVKLHAAELRLKAAEKKSN